MPTFYRIVRTDPPTERDFWSLQQLGRTLRRDTPEMRRLFVGVSVYNTLEAAQRTAREYPQIGRFIATLEIPEGEAIRFERTTADAAHYTLWGEAAVMLAAVAEVVPL